MRHCHLSSSYEPEIGNEEQKVSYHEPTFKADLGVPCVNAGFYCWRDPVSEMEDLVDIVPHRATASSVFLPSQQSVSGSKLPARDPSTALPHHRVAVDLDLNGHIF